MYPLVILCLSLVFNVVQHALNPGMPTAFWTGHIALLQLPFSGIVQSLGFLTFLPTTQHAAILNTFTGIEIPIANVSPPALFCPHDLLRSLRSTQCFDELDSPQVQVTLLSPASVSSCTIPSPVDDSSASCTDVMIVSPSDIPLWTRNRITFDYTHTTTTASVLICLMAVLFACCLVPDSWVRSATSIVRSIDNPVVANPTQESEDAFATRLADHLSYADLEDVTLVDDNSDYNKDINTPVLDKLEMVLATILDAADTEVTIVVKTPSSPPGSEYYPPRADFVDVPDAANILRAIDISGPMLPNLLASAGGSSAEVSSNVESIKAQEPLPSGPQRKPRHRCGRQVREKKARKEAERAALAGQQTTDTAASSEDICHAQPPSPAVIDIPALILVLAPAPTPGSSKLSAEAAVCVPSVAKLVAPPAQVINQPQFVPLRRPRAGRKLKEKRARQAARRRAEFADIAEAGLSTQADAPLPDVELVFTEADWPSLCEGDFVPKSLHSAPRMSYACVTAITAPSIHAVIVTDPESEPVSTRASYARRTLPKHIWSAASRTYGDFPSRVWPLEIDLEDAVKEPKKKMKA